MGSQASKLAAAAKKASTSQTGEGIINNALSTVPTNEKATGMKKRPIFVPRPIIKPALEPRVIVKKDANGEEVYEEAEPGSDPHAWRQEERLHVPNHATATVSAKRCLKLATDYGYFTHTPSQDAKSGSLSAAPLDGELKTSVMVVAATSEVAVRKVVRWDPALNLDPLEFDEEDLLPLVQEVAEAIPLPKPITAGDLPPHLLKALGALLPSNPEVPLYTHTLIHVYATTRHTHPLTPTERFEFLTLLSPSYPYALLCTECHTLHLPVQHYFHPYSPRFFPLPESHRAVSSRARDAELAISRCPSEVRIGRFLPNSARAQMLPVFPFLFSPAQVHQAVKRAGMGFDVSMHIRSLNWSRVFERMGWVHLWGVKGKVVAGRMLVRTQHWFMLHEEMKKGTSANSVFVDLLRGSEKHQSMDHCLVLCRHQRSLGKVEPMLFEKRGKLKSGKVKRKADATPVFGCTECASEFEVRLAVVEERDVLVVSAWRDLGRCESLEDKRLQSHFWEFDEQRVRERQSERLNYGWQQMDPLLLKAKARKSDDHLDDHITYPEELETLKSLAVEGKKEKEKDGKWTIRGENVDFVPESIKNAFEEDQSGLEVWVEELRRGGWWKHLEATTGDWSGERLLKKLRKEMA